MKKSQTTKKGFTLVETLMAILIFTIVAVLVVGMFAGFLKNYVVAKKVQRSAESAQYVMNLMAKTIRSSIFPDSPNPITTRNEIVMFDVTRSACVVYRWDVDTLKVATTAGISIDSCTIPAAAAFSPLTKVGEILNVSFTGVPSTGATNLGKILILARVNNGSDVLSIQTSVSLRNF